MPLLPRLSLEDNNSAYVIGLGALSKSIPVKQLEQCLTHSKYYYTKYYISAGYF